MNRERPWDYRRSKRRRKGRQRKKRKTKGKTKEDRQSKTGEGDRRTNTRDRPILENKGQEKNLKKIMTQEKNVTARETNQETSQNTASNTTLPQTIEVIKSSGKQALEQFMPQKLPSNGSDSHLQLPTNTRHLHSSWIYLKNDSPTLMLSRPASPPSPLLSPQVFYSSCLVKVKLHSISFGLNGALRRV